MLLNPNEETFTHENLLTHYIQIFPQMLNKETCDYVIKQMQLKTVNYEQHTFYNSVSNTNDKRSGENELDITYDDFEGSQNIMNLVYVALTDYSKLHKHFEGWEGYSSLRLNKYEKNKRMANHVDHIKSLFNGSVRGIPILSIVGLLNDDYEGGEFIMFNNKKLDLKQGDILIFPSVFLYPHRVEPIKKGARYSFVSWAW
jgi:hypothetical protein